MPILYRIGEREYTKNLLNDCKTPPKTLDRPKKKGDKNIIRVRSAVIACFSAENPGTISLTNQGAKAIPIIDNTNNNQNSNEKQPVLNSTEVSLNTFYTTALGAMILLAVTVVLISSVDFGSKLSIDILSLVKQ